MSRGDGGGVGIVSGFPGQHATGEVRPKLKQSTELDTHLTQKAVRDAARSNPGGQPKQKKQKLSSAERKTENQARKHFRESPKEVFVEHRRGGEIIATRTVKRK